MPREPIVEYRDCIRCGLKFRVMDSRGTHKVRCKPCMKIHRKEYNKEYRKRRQKEGKK